MPVRWSGSLSIHTDDSMLLQRHLHGFLRRRRHHIHRLDKGAGIPHACIGDLSTIPPPLRPYWIHTFPPRSYPGCTARNRYSPRSMTTGPGFPWQRFHPPGRARTQAAKAGASWSAGVNTSPRGLFPSPSRSCTSCRQETPATRVSTRRFRKGTVDIDTLPMSKPCVLMVR